MESLSYLYSALSDADAATNPELAARELSLPRWAWPWALATGLASGLLLAVPPVTASVLRPGDRSPQVRAVQVQLQADGYFHAEPTGYFGPQTRAAVRRFQAARGLAADGIVGPATRAALQGQSAALAGKGAAVAQASEGASNSTVLRSGDRGDRVRQLQQRLQAAGVYDGPLSGVFGERTEAAVRRLQEQRGLTVDGIAGPATWSALESSAAAASSSAPTAASTRRWQQKLQALGYYRQAPNGEYDDTMRVAVRRFQGDRGLAIDGIIGPATSQALTDALDPATVRALQTRLQEGGFYEGSIDGIWGPQTQAAVSAARDVYGVSVSDLVKNNY